jgi:N-methylhydantoinase A
VITDHILAVDTGGTFTDIVACAPDGRVVRAAKTSTTPHDPSEGILEAFQSMDAGPVGAFLHGTTTATNALLERRGARTALLTTMGFRDVLELGRQGRPSLYDWFDAKPDPLVPRELSFEIDERLTAAGETVRPLNDKAARATIRTLAELGIESIAVSLLHSYVEPRHEQRLRELLAEELPDAHVSLSSDVLPEIMEFERTSTTAANAYLAPVMEGYLQRLRARLKDSGLQAPVYVMQSSGGLRSAATIAERAVQTVLSGPAAGVIGGLASTSSSAKSEFLTIDMGGTSFDIAYAEGSRPSVSRESVLDGIALAVPALDIHTLGAGGGSIAWIDRGGSLRVGPASAGAQPGPAAYGRGGTEPTVTDANVVLGRLGVELLGGRLGLDHDAAHRAIERKLARPLGVSVVDAARGVIEVVNAAMAKGMHLMSVARGRDPRNIGVVGFGGAGPLHACELAAAMQINEVIIPALPGNTSAVGLALASVRREQSTTVLAPLEAVPGGDVERTLSELADQVVSGLLEDGVALETIELQAFARISYEGQRYQLRVPLGDGAPWTPGTAHSGRLAGAAERFRNRHLSVYGYVRSEPLWLYSLDVVGLSPLTGGAAAGAPVDGGGDGAPLARRDVWFGDDFVDTAVYARAQLGAGATIAGPAIVEQPDTTVVVPPGWAGDVDAQGCLVLRSQS